MAKYNHNIEDWWRHLGTWDRQQASGYPFFQYLHNPSTYIEATDEWWESLSAEQKEEIYNEFFSED